MKAADHLRKERANELKSTLDFKNGLGRFCSTYAYVAQLIEFNDPKLENFASFAKLLQKRLGGDAPENIDLRGLVLTGFDIKAAREVSTEDEKVPVLKPVAAGSENSKSDDPRYLTEIIDRLNHLFGDATPLRDQATFVNHIISIAKENHLVMAQIDNNTRGQALKGNLPGAVQDGVVRALTSHQKLATLVLKSDRQAMAALTDLIYEMLHSRKSIDIEGVDL